MSLSKFLPLRMGAKAFPRGTHNELINKMFQKRGISYDVNQLLSLSKFPDT